MFLLNLSLRPWRLAPFSHAFSAVAVGFLLLLSGFLFWMQSGLGPVVARLEGEQVVTAYLDASVEPAQETAVVDSIRTSLGAHAEGAAGAVEVKLVGTTQFIDNLRESYPDLGRELESLGSETAAIVPRYVSISGLLPDEALSQVKAVSGIESAESSRDRYAHIVGAFKALRWVAGLLIAGVALALLTGLIHLSRMNAFMHRETFAILRLWGASESEAHLPGMISGALVGAAGGLLAFAGWLSAGRSLSMQVRTLSPMLREMPLASVTLAAGLVLAGIAIGLLAGVLGGTLDASGSRSGARG